MRSAVKALMPTIVPPTSTVVVPSGDAAITVAGVPGVMSFSSRNSSRPGVNSSSSGIRVIVAFEPGEDGKAQAVHGDSYVAVIEFSDPIRAEALLSYGNATQPGSSHVGDQLGLFVEKKLRPVWRTREDIEAHLKEREVFE